MAVPQSSPTAPWGEERGRCLPFPSLVTNLTCSQCCSGGYLPWFTRIFNHCLPITLSNTPKPGDFNTYRTHHSLSYSPRGYVYTSLLSSCSQCIPFLVPLSVNNLISYFKATESGESFHNSYQQHNIYIYLRLKAPWSRDLALYLWCSINTCEMNE